MNRPDFSHLLSDVTDVGSPVSVNTIASYLRHHEVAIQFFDDAAAGEGDRVLPGAGFVAITYETVANAGAPENWPDSPIVGVAPVTLFKDGNVNVITATPSGITTATHYILAVTSSRS